MSPLADKLRFDELGYVGDGIVHLSARFGFQDLPNLPEALDWPAPPTPSCGPLDLDGASYFLSRITIRLPTRRHEPLAEAALPGARPQRREPDRVLRPPRGPHGPDGDAGRRLAAARPAEPPPS